jgi:uncharacterized membrane protein
MWANPSLAAIILTLDTDSLFSAAGLEIVIRPEVFSSHTNVHDNMPSLDFRKLRHPANRSNKEVPIIVVVSLVIIVVIILLIAILRSKNVGVRNNSSTEGN